MKISRRQLAIGALALAGAGGVAAGLARLLRPAPSTLDADVGQMLMLGFGGASSESRSAQTLAEHIAAGRVASVLFVKENIGSLEDVRGLIRLFTADAETPPLIAIDHEGGAVQRLTGRHGFTKLPSALKVAETMSPEEAKALYAEAARQFADLGFNLNLGPVVDLHDPANPAIGKYGRSYSADPAVVVAYAEAFIDAFREAGIVCAVKHFPGQGLALTDSHDVLPDIGSAWSEKDLEPYVALIASGRAQMVLGAHVALSSIESEPIPATLSPAIVTGLLREKLGFSGVAMTDDLDMHAVSNTASRRDTILRAIKAGDDLLMLRNVDPFEPLLPQQILGWVSEAVAKGELRAADVADSAERIRALRENLARQ